MPCTIDLRTRQLEAMRQQLEQGARLLNSCGEQEMTQSLRAQQLVDDIEAIESLDPQKQADLPRLAWTTVVVIGTAAAWGLDLLGAGAAAEHQARELLGSANVNAEYFRYGAPPLILGVELFAGVLRERLRQRRGRYQERPSAIEWLAIAAGCFWAGLISTIAYATQRAALGDAITLLAGAMVGIMFLGHLLTFFGAGLILDALQSVLTWARLFPRRMKLRALSARRRAVLARVAQIYLVYCSDLAAAQKQFPDARTPVGPLTTNAVAVIDRLFGPGSVETLTRKYEQSEPR